MRAAVLETLGSPLVIGDLPDPTAGAGELVVDVLAAPVLNYARDVFDGTRPLLFELPMVPGPGAVGRVRAIAVDATRIAVGDVVYCDSTIRARDDAVTPEIILQGWTARGPGGLVLQRHFKHGSFAEQMLVPAENVTRLGEVADHDAPRWCAMGALLVPFGGFLAGDLHAGETVVVNGATGNFGSAAVAVALGMGAGRVVATGRSTAILEALTHRFDRRLVTVSMTGDEPADTSAITDAASGPVDLVLDLLPPAASPAQVRSALLTVRPDGRVVLMGGVTEDLAVPYAWLMRNNVTVRGQWMYPRWAPHRMIAMIRSGQVSIDGFDVSEFPLADISAAVAHARAHAGPFRTTVVCPQR